MNLERPRTTTLITLLLTLVGCTVAWLPAAFGSSGVMCTDKSTADPFADSNPEWAPPKNYTGPLFKLSHKYPTSPPPPANPPWRKAIHDQRITKENAEAYVEALKHYVAEKGMKTLLYHYKHWDATEKNHPWYNSPWLQSIREPIHGTFVGSLFSANTFSSLKTSMSTYVLVYYNKTAAYQLEQVWGTNVAKPIITPTSGQFPEGSVIVKPAFTTASGEDWPPMEGAQPWHIYTPLFNSLKKKDPPPKMQKVHLLQFDIIVKDSLSSPRTGWVFSTLVFDKSVKSNDPWDKMVPLGAIWGGDPTVIEMKPPPSRDWVNPKLQENWINSQAPGYSRETLGWGGRLAGPNDGAVLMPAWVGSTETDGKLVKRLRASSCMGCHSSAQYVAESVLLPIPMTIMKNDEVYKQRMWMYNNKVPWPYTPGSADWMSYFQSRSGTNSMNKGSFGLDYDMVLSFQAIRFWATCTKPPKKDLLERSADDYRLPFDTSN